MTQADALAIARALAVVPIVWLLGADQRVAALALFGVAAITDALDGWLARRSRPTNHGALIDPLADKVLVVGTLAGLAAIGSGWPVTLVAVLVAARELAVAGLRVRAFRRGVVLRADTVAKVKTAAEMAGIALVILNGRPWAVLGAGLVGLAFLAGIATLPRYVNAHNADAP